MDERLKSDCNIDSKTFKEYYYLKKELIAFCKKNSLQTTGSKEELIERISIFLDTGKKTYSNHNKKTQSKSEITLNDIVEENLVCSEKLRTFYKEQIGKNFTFNVAFQKWLKNNVGKTYKDSIDAYYQILSDKKKNKTNIDKQFEYNTYIRDFFSDNKGLSLNDAIKCWKYKKGLKGNNKYEKCDLIALR